MHSIPAVSEVKRAIEWLEQFTFEVSKKDKGEPYFELGISEAQHMFDIFQKLGKTFVELKTDLPDAFSTKYLIKVCKNDSKTEFEYVCKYCYTQQCNCARARHEILIECVLVFLRQIKDTISEIVNAS